ncbi:MAG: hypothetical protein ACYC9Y_10775 [Candidatus Methylomirabilia bacterium]
MIKPTAGAPTSPSRAGHPAPTGAATQVLQACPDISSRQRGAFLIIAAVFMLIVLAFLGAVFLSTFTTSTSTATNELQSTRAFYVAEGGLAFHQRDLALDLDWYRSAADPRLATTDKVLGAGEFTANTFLPASMLSARMCDPALPSCSPPPPIRSYTTDRFPSSGDLQIEDDLAGHAEFVHYTGISGSTFTGITRNVTIGGLGGTAVAHARGSRIYPVTTLLDVMPDNCNTIAALRVAAHAKFLGGGTLSVEAEEISYAGSASAAGVLTLQGVRRCQNGTCASCTPAPTHAVGIPVTPLLFNAVAPDYEAQVVSTGTVGTSVRVARNTIQR